MKRFEFRLQTALRLRRMQAERERARLSELLALRERLESSLRALYGERAEAARFTAAGHEPARKDLRSLSAFVVGWEGRMSHLAEEISAAKREIAEQVTRVREAEQQERALEKMREKALAEWRHEADRQLEGTAQELWLYSHTTNSRGNPHSS